MRSRETRILEHSFEAFVPCGLPPSTIGLQVQPLLVQKLSRIQNSNQERVLVRLTSDQNPKISTRECVFFSCLALFLFLFKLPSGDTKKKPETPTAGW